jgi:hypothetical protein
MIYAVSDKLYVRDPEGFTPVTLRISSATTAETSAADVPYLKEGKPKLKELPEGYVRLTWPEVLAKYQASAPHDAESTKKEG